MGIIQGNSRLSHHTVTGVGQTFSVPQQEDFTLSGSMSWTPTDLALSEIGVNEADQTVFIRTGQQINQIALVGSTSSGNSLEQVLAIGNDSGTYSIVMGTSTVIKSDNGGGQIDLDYGGISSTVNISTDNGAYTNSILMGPNTVLGVDFNSYTGSSIIDRKPTGLETSIINVYDGKIDIGVTRNVGGSTQYICGIYMGQTYTKDVSSNGLGLGFAGVIINSIGSTSSIGTKNIVILGGQNNIISVGSANSVILGGSDNYISNLNNSISAGTFVTISNAGNNQVSGNENLVDASHGNIVGGQYHTIQGNVRFVDSNLVTGESNALFNCFSNAVSGRFNSLTASTDTIVSGYGNTITGTEDTNVSGNGNIITNSYRNNISGLANNISGGSNENIVSGGGNILGTASGGNIVGGSTNILVTSAFGIVSGLNNSLNNVSNTSVFGSNINATQSNTTYVNNLKLEGSSSALTLSRLTTTQKNALTAVNGMIVYDTTLNKFQGYENGAWTNLI